MVLFFHLLICLLHYIRGLFVHLPADYAPLQRLGLHYLCKVNLKSRFETTCCSIHAVTTVCVTWQTWPPWYRSKPYIVAGGSLLWAHGQNLFVQRRTCLFYVTTALTLCLVKCICKSTLLSALSTGEETWGSRHSCVFVCVHSCPAYCMSYICVHICICFYWRHVLSSRQGNWSHLYYTNNPFCMALPWYSGLWLNVAWGWGGGGVSACVWGALLHCVSKWEPVCLAHFSLTTSHNFSPLPGTERLLAKRERREPVSYFCLVLCLW